MLFWIYIFLVFFVMMSVFIAILSEGYEAAKSVIPATASGNIWEAVQTVAVTNYKEMKENTKSGFRKATGQNEAVDRWSNAGQRARVGVQVRDNMKLPLKMMILYLKTMNLALMMMQMADAVSAFQADKNGDHIGATTHLGR